MKNLFGFSAKVNTVAQRIGKKVSKAVKEIKRNKRFVPFVMLGIQVLIIVVTAIVIVIPTPKAIKVVKAVNADNAEDKIAIDDKPVKKRIVKKMSLEKKYKKLGGVYYADTIKPYLKAIDKVLKKRGYDDNKKFIQVMFYVGQHESHWNVNSVSGAYVGREHPMGIFQFLPSTFRTVSNGKIFSAGDQVDAFVTMYEQGRLDEYGVMYICSYGPCLSYELKAYALGY